MLLRVADELLLPSGHCVGLGHLGYRCTPWGSPSVDEKLSGGNRWTFVTPSQTTFVPGRLIDNILIARAYSLLDE